jgi:hypothetical protein
MTFLQYRQTGAAALKIGMPLGYSVALVVVIANVNSDSSRTMPGLSPIPVAASIQVLQSPSPAAGKLNPSVAVAQGPFSTQNGGITPGVYKAMPDSILIVVPRPVDSGMVCMAPSTSKINMPCLQPPMQLQRQ